VKTRSLLLVRATCLLAAASLIVATSAASPSDEEVSVAVAEHEELGSYLVDGEGMSLYLFTRDGDGSSACEGDCAVAWPPLLVEGRVAFGRGVDLGLLGTTERSDGTHQLTYAGWPLYGYAQDQEPGDVGGHGVNDAWFLIDPRTGEALATTARQSGVDDTTDGADFEVLMEEGARIFRHVTSPPCSSCHGDAGQGAPAGPPLIGSRTVESPRRLVSQIVSGGQFMPGFGSQLSDFQVAAVATYVRNSWGNDYGPISEEEVNELR
jgi:predicted lipoprotein with Yx(FWY)xxD motif/cytochrome c5